MSVAQENSIEKREAVERLYAVLAGDDSQDRACDVISQQASISIPANFLLNLLDGICTKLAEQLVCVLALLGVLLSLLMPEEDRMLEDR